MKQNLTIKENILNTAKHHFYNNGYVNTTTRMIAKSLGIYHSKIFYYFKNKEEVLKYIFEEYYKKQDMLIFEMKPDLTDIELILSSIYIGNYFISFNKKFSKLYFEATDIVIGVLYNEYAKHTYPRIEHDDVITNPSKKENKYLIDLSVLLNAERAIFKLVKKNDVTLTNKELRNYIVDLSAKILDIDDETFKTSKETAGLIARKIDYSRLNIFSDSYKITLY